MTPPRQGDEPPGTNREPPDESTTPPDETHHPGQKGSTPPMTLSTKFRITTPGISPEGVWAKANELIGAGTDTLFDITRRTDDILTMNRPGQGFSALLFMYTPTGPDPIDPDPDGEAAKFGMDPGPAHYVEVVFDTGYGYRDARGCGCEDLHRDLTAALGAWVADQGGQWAAQDEYTGEWRMATPCPIG